MTASGIKLHAGRAAHVSAIALDNSGAASVPGLAACSYYGDGDGACQSTGLALNFVQQRY